MTFDKNQAYADTRLALAAVLEGESDTIAIMATTVCLLARALPYYYWTGFYRVQNNNLIIGPYQGTLGCMHIAWGKGVCGTAAATGKTQVVEDVHQFPGHIACDAKSASEIVVPVFDKDKQLIAVFDVDALTIGAFDQTDQFYLEQILAEQFSARALT